MANFTYQGRDASGTLVTGQIDAETARSVADRLLSQGITPIDIVNSSSFGREESLLSRDILQGSVKKQDLVIFCRQMSTLLKAGVPINDALTQLMSASRSKRLSNILHDIAGGVAEGQNLSQALKRHVKVFSEVFVSMIDAGESTGKLDTAFSELAKHLQFDINTRKRTKAALRYPIMVFVALFIALIVVNFFVIPAFSSMFSKMGGKLPLATRIIVTVSNFMIAHKVGLAVGLVAIILIIYTFLKSKRGSFLWDKWKLKTPVFGNIMYQIILGRFARIFAMMSETGIPLLSAINLIAHTVDNQYVAFKIRGMQDYIESGETITHAASQVKMFSPFVLQMLSVGESSGSLDNMLKEVADYYEREVDYDLDQLGALIEPFLLIVLAGMILLVMLGVFLPMWELVSLAR